MTNRRSVVLASNRGPVSFHRSASQLELKRGAGGLAGALDPVARNLGDEMIWIAAATSQEDRDAVASGEADRLSDELGYPVQLLTIAPDTYARYYDNVANRMLWFAQHCLWDEVGDTAFDESEVEDFHSAYRPVNEQFADAVAAESAADGLVLFQDYHLALAPRMLRDKRPDTTTFHFTHSSFCGPSGFKPLPGSVARDVVRGMLGSDLVGFHVPRWAHGFFDCCERIDATVDRTRGTVEYDGHLSWVRTYPIPIEPTELRQRVDSAEEHSWAERFHPQDDTRLIVRADRCEPSKNVIRGFRAFERLLDERADLRDKTHFVACLYPSRQTMSEYREYADAVEATVREIAARYPGAIDLYMEDNFDRTLGALSVYDVLLVNPIMDGMNLVSKEGPALNGRDGVLVLSSGAGSFEELGAYAVPIQDPLDIGATAEALARGLDMPAEDRRVRSDALRGIVESSTPAGWIDSQLNDLEAIRAGNPPITAAPRPSAP